MNVLDDFSAEVTAYPEWKQAAIDAAGHFEYGDVISHEWLYEHFDMVPPDHGTADEFKKFQFQFLSYVENFKYQMLEEYKMLLLSRRGVGYEIVAPEEQTAISWDMMKNQVRKELNRANARLSNILIDALSEEAIADNRQKQATLAAIRAMNERMIETSEDTQEAESGTV